MNTKFLILITLNFLFLGCKEAKFSRYDITETDNAGKLIGNVDERDWTLQSLSKFSESEKKVFSYFFNSKHFSWLEGKSIKIDCNSSEPLLSLVAYPNPAKRNGIVYFKLHTNMEYVSVFYATTGKKGDVYLSGGGVIFPEWLYNHQSADNNDFSLYYVIIDKDSCAHFGKGDIIVN